MPSPFDPVPTIQHGSVVGTSQTPPLTLRTDPRQWAYAAAFGRATADATSGCIAARVTLHVVEGRVGVGVLDRAEARFLDETLVDAGPGPVAVDLLADAGPLTGPLVVRNASADGPSLVTVLGVQALEVEVADGRGVWPADDWDVALSQPPVTPGWARFYGTQRRTLNEKLRSRRFAALDAPIIVSWADGLRFRIVPDDHLSRVLFVSGTYEPNTLRILRTLVSPGDDVIDAGANAGIVSLVAAAWVGPTGRVLAIEPSAREFQRLAEHVALNQLDRVTPIRAAVAAQAGSRTLRIAAMPRSGLNTLGPEFSVTGASLDGLETVDAITIDDLVAREALRRVRAIKLDVEGAELEALEGAAAVLRAHRPALIVEVCARALASAEASVPQLEARLRGHGYTLFEIDDDTGALRPVSALAPGPDRNVVALPAERAGADG